MPHCMRPHRGRRREIPSTPDRRINHQLPSSFHFCLNLNKFSSLIHVTLSLLLLVLNVPSSSGLPHKHTSDRLDFVCNNDDSHECVCSRFSGNLDNKVIECTQFLGVPTVQVIKMTLRKINLESRLHTNETYQEYFRRRIANMISQHCEHQANECPGIQLRIPKVDTDDTFLDDYYEPPITQDNVVILRVNFLIHDRTEIYFVVTKDAHVQTLSQSVLMEPSKIKTILIAQRGPLSRVLGGVSIEGLEEDTITRTASLDDDNSSLIRILVIIAIIMGIMYIVAVTKCVRQSIRKKKLKRRRETEQKYGPTYGTCTEKLLSDYDKRNGKPKSTSIASRESISSTRRAKKSSEVKTPTLKTPTIEDDRPSLDARSFNRMFACDPSQLPAEYHGLSVEQDDDSVNLLMPSPPSTARSIVPTKEDPSMPSVILVSSSTPDTMGPSVPKIEMQVDSPEPSGKPAAASAVPAPISLLDTSTGFNPYERPLSRRGSRNSTPEEGEEFGEDREDTPQPIGDEASILAGKLEKIPENDPLVARSHTAHKFGHWSSDSESENEVYQRLSEVSEEDEVETQTGKKKRKKVRKNASSDIESVTTDEDDKEIDEEEMLERHQYERLQESPTPAKTLPDMSLELDSALQ